MSIYFKHVKLTLRINLVAVPYIFPTLAVPKVPSFQIPVAYIYTCIYKISSWFIDYALYFKLVDFSVRGKIKIAAAFVYFRRTSEKVVSLLFKAVQYHWWTWTSMLF